MDRLKFNDLGIPFQQMFSSERSFLLHNAAQRMRNHWVTKKLHDHIIFSVGSSRDFFSATKTCVKTQLSRHETSQDI